LSVELQHQIHILSSCFNQGFYITGIHSQHVPWLSSFTELVTLWLDECFAAETQGREENITLTSFAESIISSPGLLLPLPLQEILTYGTICHPDLHTLTNSPHPEDAEWHFLDVSKGYKLLVKHCIKLIEFNSTTSGYDCYVLSKSYCMHTDSILILSCLTLASDHALGAAFAWTRWLRYLKKTPQKSSQSLIPLLKNFINYISNENQLVEMVTWLKVYELSI